MWALSYHLLPRFAHHRLSEITPEDIDLYKAAKLREGRLAPNAINKTLTRLAQILEVPSSTATSSETQRRASVDG